MASILLAEDDDDMRTFLARALNKAGHEVCAVPNGSEAVDALKDDGFDLLIADIVMPGMDGIELARRATREVPTMRVMFITGFAAVALRARQARFHEQETKVLSKPFHLRDLVEHVEKMLAA